MQVRGFLCALRARVGKCTFIIISSCIGYNTWGMNVSWMVSGVGVYTFLKMYICIDCDDNNFGSMCQLNIYMLVLDITCQQLGDECKLEGFCVPFGHRVVECTFLKMYICIGYVMSTILGACVS